MDCEDFSKDDCSMDDEAQLPGFRFHPTDQELVGFYLRRKLDGKPLSVELIKQIDIYKYDPWDLPKASSTGGEKEWYFFCKRGRKYRNSIRPNRVTGSGFWKATGIDKPVYSLAGEGNDCIGLKKTLVYYRGSAGKGTKTDWMMHEFRLPSNNDTVHNSKLPNANAKNDSTIAQDAEVWTLCRIFKRIVTQRKFTPDWRQLAAKRQSNVDKNARTSSVDSNTNQESYINFGASSFGHYEYQKEQKPFINNYTNDPRNNQFHHVSQFGSHQLTQAQPQLVSPSSDFWINQSANDYLFAYENWDELGSVVKFGHDSPLM